MKVQGDERMNDATQTILVSVIMPVYNGARFVEAAIRSVIGQTHTNWELIVIDDGSADGTCAIVERLAEQDPRIRLYRNPRNMGVAHTRNRGFSLCTGAYVALLDGDDIWFPEKLELQLQLARETGAELIYCSYQIVDENTQPICDDFIVPESTDFRDSLTRSVMSCSTTLLSSTITQHYRFDPQYYHEDLVLWLQLLRDGYQARGVTQVCAQYRVMKGSRASNKLRTALRRWEVYRGFLGLSPVKAFALMVRYALLGFKKYKAI